MTCLRYLRDNKGGVVKAELMKKVREETKDRSDNYTQKKLKK
ncbi:hypothetical protein ACFPK9_06570 [Rubritalea spongiae]|uniref:Uncharacterized protein n=1 Tax=Rubritalea spongiae TaxID=430797 RepID=A0ABW5E562_9BACT